MNAQQIKQYCKRCDCMVKVDGHEERCRPKQERGWSVAREMALVGDTVHQLDVQLAIRLSGVPNSQLGAVLERYKANKAMAQYMVSLGADAARSEAALGTQFEANYSGKFRRQYLQAMFPDVWLNVYCAWMPPALNRSGVSCVLTLYWVRGFIVFMIMVFGLAFHLYTIK